MADNLTTQSATPATVPSSSVIATDDVSGVHFQRVKLVDGTADSSVAIAGDATNGLDVDVTRVQGTVTVADGGGTLSVDDGGGSLTVDGTVAVSGSVAVTGPLTDTQLRASAVPVSGSVSVSNFPATQPVSGPLTDTQLRASAVPVSGTVTITDGSGPVTVDGTVSVSNFPATQPVSGTVAVTGALTDAELRATDLDVAVTNSVSVTGTFWQTTQPVVQVPTATANGLLIKRLVTAATSNNPLSIKTSAAGQLYGVVAGNANSAPRYLHLYDSATMPAIGTTAPTLVATFIIPGNTAGAGLVLSFDNGIAFSSGMHCYVTTTIDGSSAGTLGADCVVNFFYK